MERHFHDSSWSVNDFYRLLTSFSFAAAILAVYTEAMKKAGAKKHMTLDLLAEAMQAGFSQLDERIDGLTLLTARQFDQVDERLDRVEGSVLGIRRDMLAFHDKWSEHENRITSLEEKSI